MLATRSAKKAAKTNAKPAPRAKLERLIKHLGDQDQSKARALSRELLKKHPEDVNVLSLAAQLALNVERNPELCLERSERALKRAPTAPEAHKAALMARTALGDRDGLAAAAERWIAADPARATPYYELARVDARRCAAHVPVMQGLLALPQTNGLSKAMLLNAFGLIHEKEQRLDRAFQAFLGSKQALDRRYDAPAFQRFFDACEAICTKMRLEALADLGATEARMVFVVGLPRTGSTLIERVIAAHPEAEAMGETGALDRVLRSRNAGVDGDGPVAARIEALLSSGADAMRAVGRAYREAVAPVLSDAAATRWIDKMPGNFIYAGLIAALFPNARIVMTDRDPRDAMLSCLRTFFTHGQSFTADFGSFLAHWRVQQAFAALWRERLGARCLDIPYEEMIADPEAQARRLIAHIGLDWYPRCARPEEQGGVVQTASAFQVRKKIHARSVGGWRRYETEFAPMNDALARMGWSPR